MVLDTFIFYNELDLLEIRFNILDPYVDRFVLIEAKETFSGLPKKLYFKENRDRYAKWADKIIHYVVDDNDEALWAYSKASPNVGAGEHWWVREFYQKESLLKVLDGCKDDDVIFISDVDEIWNPEIKIECEYGKIYRPIQEAYHYFLNNRSNQDIHGWVGTRFGTYKTVKEHGVNHFRVDRYTPSIQIPNGGWHFSNIGDEQFIKAKIEAYGHQEYNVDSIKNSIAGAIEGNRDFLGRGFTLWKDESNLPKYLLDNKQKWIKLFRS